jgi:hypothetical protein
MTDTDELKTEGTLAIAKNMRIGHYAIEAADEIDLLRSQLFKSRCLCDNRTTVRECVESGQCGCTNGSLLEPVLRQKMQKVLNG